MISYGNPNIFFANIGRGDVGIAPYNRNTTAPVIPTKPQARGGISQLEKLRIFREIPRLPLVARDDMRFR